MSNEIICTACGKTALVRKEPCYEGFRKIGENVICTACGHVYTDGQPVPWNSRKSKNSLFSEKDKPEAISIFQDDERGRGCRYCQHYVVNPFTQRCDLHARTVTATDICEDFVPKK